MIARYQALAQRIKQEIEELEVALSTIQSHWERAGHSEVDKRAYLNSVALNLHGFYSGLERVFHLIASEFDGGSLGGEGWHTELLRQMTLDLPGTRPPILETETADHLDEYRKFRHLVRHVYTTAFDPDRIDALVSVLPKVWSEVRRDLTTFTAFLEDLSKADES